MHEKLFEYTLSLASMAKTRVEGLAMTNTGDYYNQWNSTSLCSTNISLKVAALKRSTDIYFHGKNDVNK